jgi:hypothetical protein
VHSWIEGAGMDSSGRHAFDAPHQGGTDLPQDR